jgi:hypothetical protein
VNRPSHTEGKEGAAWGAAKNARNTLIWACPTFIINIISDKKTCQAQFVLNSKSVKSILLMGGLGGRRAPPVGALQRTGSPKGAPAISLSVRVTCATPLRMPLLNALAGAAAGRGCPRREGSGRPATRGWSVGGDFPLLSTAIDPEFESAPAP